MFNIHVQRNIDKPIDEVFSLLSDHANYAQFKGVDKSSLIKQGHPNKNGVGAVREIVAGKSLLHEQIVKFEPPQHLQPELASNKQKVAMLGYQIVFSKPLPYNHIMGEINLSQIDNTTTVTWTSKGYITWPIIGPLFFDKQIQKNGARAFGSILKYIDTH